jgi:DNA-binding MarR family transcriptional regulator
MNEAKAAANRLREEREEIAQLEKQPLRRRLLVALGNEPASPTRLATQVAARKESVSRKLGELSAAGLVESARGADDRRQLVYSLTLAGRSEMERHLALGKRDPLPPRPDREQFEAFVREAIRGAVALRRRSNSLGEAIDRLEEIHRQCMEAGAYALALDALAELTTTQRQDRRKRQFDQSIRSLEQVVAGETAFGPALVLPAAAHLEYERGRAGDLWEGLEAERVERLRGAISLFGGLLRDRPGSDDASWSRRRAWSFASLAGVYRRQSRYEAAMRYAGLGLRGFEELEDDYGAAYSWFLFGFVLRLLRRFDEASSCLDIAHRIAARRGNDFERLRANSLMQIGDVKRCQGHTGDAKQTLAEAIELAKPMKMALTQAFAQSATGAAQFQEGDLERARATLATAQDIFLRLGHRNGIALNARRQATIARHLSEAGVKLNAPETKKLIKTAQTAYCELNSPTGVAACEIEKGWMRTFSPRCGKVAPVVRNLDRLVSGLLDDPDPRRTELLLVDAWFPAMLQDFVKASSSEVKKVAPDLIGNAREVHQRAGRKLQEQGEFGVVTINEGVHRIKNAHKAQGSHEVIEMAGESPRESVLVAA